MAVKAEGATRRKRSKRAWWIAGGAVVAVAVGVTGFLLLRPQQAQSVTTRTFTTPVTKTTETTTVSLTGILAPQQEADLSFPTSGKVTAVNVSVGSTVKAGQVLATIDGTQLQNAVTLAQANVNAAQTSYDTVAATSGVTSAQLSNAQAQVDSANAKLAGAKASLADAQLTSPIAGTVATVNLTVGSQSGAGGSGSSGSSGSAGGTSSSSTTSSAQIVVISPTSWMVNSSVGPADVGSLKIGQAVTATVSGATASATGKINTIGVVATTSSGSTTFPVTMLLTGNPTGFYDGVSVNVSVTTGTYPDVITVPTMALTNNTDGTVSVQKIVNGQAVDTPVQTGRIFADRTQITSGLAEGDQVQITVRVAAGSQRSASSGSGINFPGLGGGAGAGTRPQGNFAGTGSTSAAGRG